MSVLVKLHNTGSLISISLNNKKCYYSYLSRSTKLLTNLHVLARHGLEFCSCSMFLFEGEYSLNPWISSRTISRTALKIDLSNSGLLKGQVSTCESGLSIDVQYDLFSGYANLVSMFNQLFAVCENLDDVRVCS